jgi:hypothetical protein
MNILVAVNKGITFLPKAMGMVAVIGILDHSSLVLGCFSSNATFSVVQLVLSEVKLS